MPLPTNIRLGWKGLPGTNIRLGWKGLPGSNTLAFYKNQQITTLKFFYSTGPRTQLPSLRRKQIGLSQGWSLPEQNYLRSFSLMIEPNTLYQGGSYLETIFSQNIRLGWKLPGNNLFTKHQTRVEVTWKQSFYKTLDQGRSYLETIFLRS